VKDKGRTSGKNMIRLEEGETICTTARLQITISSTIIKYKK
jgi:hypothetical protein